MSNSIDTKIVEAKFDNKQFEGGVKNTLDSLSALKKGLQLDGAAKGLDEVSRTANRFSLRGMMDSITGVTSGFSAMTVIATTALATITHRAVLAGGAMLKSLTVAPLNEGLREYETNLNSIQTIMSNTQWENKTLNDVNQALQELNTYSDQTIYNFAEMARNIGTFTAAGVKLDTSVAAIKGIANLAAVSGSNSQQASTAMYQLSQALATGTVKLMDWNSVVNAGMGGKVFQDAIKETARNHGVNIDEMIKKNGSFRDSLREGWFTTEILTETLSKFTGDLTDKQLKSMGYTEKQIKDIQKLGNMAKDAATKVKTGTQLIGTLQEAAGSGWAQTWQLIIGDFDEAKKLWTSINDTIGGFISQNADARNKMLSDWKELGGRTALIKGIKAAFNALLQVLKPLQEAFRQIFPAQTGQNLYDLTVRFRDFMKSLKMGEESINNLKRTFAGVFAVLGIGWEILKAGFRAFAQLFGMLTEGSGGILDFTARIGDFFVALHKSIKEGDGLKNFFENMVDFLSKPIALLRTVARFIGELFSQFDVGGAEKVRGGVDSLGSGLDTLRGIGRRIMDFFGEVGDVLSRVGTTIGSALGGLGAAIADSITPETFDRALAVIRTALLGGILLTLKNFFKGGLNINTGDQGFFSGIVDTLGTVTDTLRTMQASIKADIILKIAGALALLAAAVWTLSTIDPQDIAKSMTALAIGFGGLAVVLVKLSTAMGIMGTAKLPLITASLVALAGALVLLAGAMKLMSTMSWEEIAKGLAGIAGALVAVGLAMRTMPRNMVAQAAGLVLVGVALNAIAASMKIFGTIEWDEIGRGLAAMAGSLVAIGIAMRLMPIGPSMILQAAGLVAVGVALNIIAGAMKLMSMMSYAEIARSLVLLGGSLTILALALNAMITALPGAAALVVASAALVVLSGALKLMSTFSYAEIARSLVLLSGSLLILALGLTAMIASLPGAAALLVAAGALAILTPVLITLGNLSWKTIATGLGTLAAIFVVLGLAGLVLAPIVPVIIGLAAAMVLIGAGLALAGVGALAFSTAFGVVVGAGAAGIKVLAGILETFVKAIPAAFRAFGKGLVELAKEIADNGPEFFEAAKEIIGSMLDAVIENAPKFGKALLAMLDTGLDVIVTATPKIADAGLKLVKDFLKAVDKNISDIIDIAASIIVKFLEGLARNDDKVAQAGVELIISFVNSVANAIRDNTEELRGAGLNMASAIIDGITGGLFSRAREAASAAASMARGALTAAMKAIGAQSPSREFRKVGKYAAQGFAQGLSGGKDEVIASWNLMRDLLRHSMASSKADIQDLKAKLKDLNDDKKKDLDAINKTEKALAKARSEYERSNRVLETMSDRFKKKRASLVELGKEYDKYTAKIDRANARLQAATQTRDDYNRSIRDQYSDIPDITQETGLEKFIDELEMANADINLFADILQELRLMGLSDAMYEEFLSKGPSILPFLEELLKGGKESVSVINNLSSDLAKEAKALGKTASKELYQAGVDTAQGLLDGLKKKRRAIEKEMEAMAKAIVKVIRLQLKIKSPSKVMSALGEFVGQGLANGMRRSIPVVEDAASGLGDDVLSAMKNSISGLSDLLLDDMNLNPTITPVLDLSNVRTNSAQIGSMLAADIISLDNAYSRAKDVSTGYHENRQAAMASAASRPETAPGPFSFTQNNYSPKALSQVEIYRQTKNQLSVAKGALTNATEKP